MSEKYGIIASFPDTPSFYHAAEKVRDAGYKKWDTYSSFPVHGMPAAQGQPRSKVPVFTFCGGPRCLSSHSVAASPGFAWGLAWSGL